MQETLSLEKTTRAAQYTQRLLPRPGIWYSKHGSSCLLQPVPGEEATTPVKGENANLFENRKLSYITSKYLNMKSWIMNACRLPSMTLGDIRYQL